MLPVPQSPDPDLMGPHKVGSFIYQQTNQSSSTNTYLNDTFQLGIVQSNPSGPLPQPVSLAAFQANPAFYGNFTTSGAVFDTNARLPNGSAGLPARVEVLADVYYPTDLANGPYPIVFFLHGMHNTVYNPSNGQAGLPSDFGLPNNSVDLPAGFDPIPNFIGYDYISQVMASHGYIVVSISANGINDQDNTASGGMLARAQLVQQHIQIWDQIGQNGGTSLSDPTVQGFFNRFKNR